MQENAGKVQVSRAGQRFWIVLLVNAGVLEGSCVWGGGGGGGGGSRQTAV